MSTKGPNDEFATSITCLSDYLQWVEEHQFIYYSDEGEDGAVKMYINNIYYRGQANKSWELRPSLFRDDLDLRGNGEQQILRYATARLWSEMRDQGSDLEKMAFLRHYGLPSRLLDVTTNPLIALYMAICESHDNDAVVYYGECPYSYSGHEIATVVTQYDFHQREMFALGRFLYDEEISSEIIHQLHLEMPPNELLDRLSNPCLVHTPMNSVRINAQQGAFLVAPLLKPVGKGKYERIEKYNFEATAEGRYTCSYERDEEIRENPNACFFREKVVIQPCVREKILKELDRCGINAATVYLDLDNKVLSITNKYKRQVPMPQPQPVKKHCSLCRIFFSNEKQY